MLDFIIIGQGIAGTTLAHQLLRDGASVNIIDNNPVASSSKIASGLWNPVVLKRMKKVWLADDMISAVLQFYPEIERLTQTTIVDKFKIKRILNSIEEQNTWSEISDQPKFKEILKPNVETEVLKDVHAPFGYGVVEKSGRINVLKYLESSKRYFEELKIYTQKEVSKDEVRIGNNEVKVGNLTAKNIIFCEGHQARLNPWFKYLPFAPTKGEVLIGKSSLRVSQPLHGGKFILPLGGDNFKIGATYSWGSMDAEITDSGKQQLKEGWNKITSKELNITKQQAGIRPTVKDRRPLLGSHPKYRNVHIFNGLGSRGILMAPYLANQMSEFLLGKKELHPEMDISRFSFLLTEQ